MSIAEKVKSEITLARRTGISPEIVIQPTVPNFHNSMKSKQFNTCKNNTVIDAEYSIISTQNNQHSLEYNTNYFSNNYKHDEGKISPSVQNFIKRTDKSGISKLVSSTENANFFIALIVEYFYSHKDKNQRVKCIFAFGGKERDATHYSKFQNKNVLMKYLSKNISRPPIIASLALGYLLEIRPEYCFNVFPPTKVEATNFTTQKIKEEIPSRLNARGTYYDLKGKLKIRDFSGAVEQIVCHYSFTHGNIFAVATRFQEKDGEICIKIGGAPATAWLFFRDLMSHDPLADIIVCPDLRLAMKFIEIARDGRLLERTGVIITGYIGGDETLKSLVLSDVTGHRVTILTSPGQDGWEILEKLAKRCADNGATKVDIYPWPLITDLNLSDIFPSDARANEDLVENAVDLRDIERPSMLVKKIQKMAMPLGDFKGWKNRHEMKESPGNTLIEDDAKFCITYFQDIKDVKPLNNKHSLSVSDLLNALHTALIWGYSNAGKTFFSAELAISLSTGTPCFFLSAPTPSKVCYIGGEGNKVDFKSLCLQLMKNRPEYHDLLNKNLGCYVAKGGLNILNDKNQDEIIDCLLKDKTKYLFIDNLISLSSSASNNNPSQLFKFVHKIEKIGISVILIHHANKDKQEIKGSVDLISRCQNVLHLEGREQFTEKATYSLAMKTALADDGPVTRITIDKCKIAPHFERRSVVYRVPVSGTWEWVEGDIQNGCGASKSQGINTDFESNSDESIPEAPIPPDAVKILSIMHDDTTYYRSDIEKITGFKEDRTRKSLALLMKAGVVIREGESKGTYYRKA